MRIGLVGSKLINQEGINKGGRFLAIGEACKPTFSDLLETLEEGVVDSSRFSREEALIPVSMVSPRGDICTPFVHCHFEERPRGE